MALMPIFQILDKGLMNVISVSLPQSTPASSAQSQRNGALGRIVVVLATATLIVAGKLLKHCCFTKTLSGPCTFHSILRKCTIYCLQSRTISVLIILYNIFINTLSQQ